MQSRIWGKRKRENEANFFEKKLWKSQKIDHIVGHFGLISCLKKTQKFVENVWLDPIYASHLIVNSFLFPWILSFSFTFNTHDSKTNSLHIVKFKLDYLTKCTPFRVSLLPLSVYMLLFLADINDWSNVWCEWYANIASQMNHSMALIVCILRYVVFESIWLLVVWLDVHWIFGGKDFLLYSLCFICSLSFLHCCSISIPIRAKNIVRQA